MCVLGSSAEVEAGAEELFGVVGDDEVVEQPADGEPAQFAVDLRAGHFGGRKSSVHRVDEEFAGRPGWRGGGGAVGAVDVDCGVEMDSAPGLVYGDLRVGQAGVVAQFSLAETRGFGDRATKVGGEAGPDLGGVGVPEHRGFVAVGVGVEGTAGQRVAEGVGVAAAGGPQCAAWW